MPRRLSVLALVLAIAFGTAACGDTEPNRDGSTSSSIAPDTTAANITTDGYRDLDNDGKSPDPGDNSGTAGGDANPDAEETDR